MVRTLVVACGALTREIRAVLAQLPGGDSVRVEYLPASLHNRPEQITPAIEALLDDNGGEYDHIAVAYADCGTGGHLDAALARRGIERLAGAHCYEFFAGADTFAALHDEEPGTFYLTDFLARHFDQLVIVGLGLDRYPHLRDTYFGHYRKLVLLSQTDAVDLVERGEAAADRLGLTFEHRPVGLAPFEAELRRLIPVRIQS